jgi:hypothetical protein
MNTDAIAELEVMEYEPTGDGNVAGALAYDIGEIFYEYK